MAFCNTENVHKKASAMNNAKPVDCLVALLRGLCSSIPYLIGASSFMHFALLDGYIFDEVFCVKGGIRGPSEKVINVRLLRAYAQNSAGQADDARAVDDRQPCPRRPGGLAWHDAVSGTLAVHVGRVLCKYDQLFLPARIVPVEAAPTLVGDECAHQMHCVVRFAIGPGVHLRDGYIADGLCRVAGAQNVEAGLEVDNLLVHRPRQMIVDTVSVVLIMRVRYGDNVSGGLNINVNRSI